MCRDTKPSICLSCDQCSPSPRSLGRLTQTLLPADSPREGSALQSLPGCCCPKREGKHEQQEMGHEQTLSSVSPALVYFASPYFPRQFTNQRRDGHLFRHRLRGAQQSPRTPQSHGAEEIWSSNKDAAQMSRSQEEDLICLNILIMFIVFSSY